VKIICRKIFRFLFTISILASVCIKNPCSSQTTFLIGGQNKWIKKGRPFDFNGAKINIYDITCMDARLHGVNFSLVQSKVRTIYGLSLSLFALCDQMTGFQFALFNRITTLKGVEVGIINVRTHFVKPNIKSGNYGLQIGLVNASSSNKGIQLGLYNHSLYGDKGFSIGGLNINSRYQIGIINVKKKEYNKGIQFGIINYREDNKWYARILPLVNFRVQKHEMN
jgi:hypothetical protein